MAYAKDPRDPNMASYQRFAQGDAYDLAEWLVTDFDLVAVRRLFEGAELSERRSFEMENVEALAALIRKSPSQRPAYLRRICKGLTAQTQGTVIVFAIIALLRVEALIERDRYRYALTPGDSNRETCASIYEFHQESLHIPQYDWPDEILGEIREGLGLYDDE